MEDFVLFVVLAIALALGIWIGVSAGKDLMLDWVCADNGYYTGQRQYGIRYCVADDGDYKEFVPLDEIVLDLEE